MPTKYFVEKEIAIDKNFSKEKESGKHEKVEKSEKDGKDHKDLPDNQHKQLKDKHEKEHKERLGETKEQFLEKTHKDTETFPQTQETAAAAPQAAQTPLAPEKLTDKFLPEGTKLIKLEIKEFKHEKFEIKELKHEFKEFKREKLEIKEIETIPGGVPPGDPGEGISVSQRLSALEAAVTQLLHFIPAELRPDLSKGALRQEPDAAQSTGGEQKTGD